MFAAEINAAPRKRLDIILRMNSLRRTSAESMRLLVSNLYSDRILTGVQFVIAIHKKGVICMKQGELRVSA